MDYYKKVVFKNYVVFSGRARRAEYWYFVLFNIIISAGLSIISQIIGDKKETLSSLYSLAVFLPSIAVGFRRLHDIGKSGWWMLLCLIPIIGWVWLIILFATDSNPGENMYGKNPKEAPIAK